LIVKSWRTPCHNAYGGGFMLLRTMRSVKCCVWIRWCPHTYTLMQLPSSFANQEHASRSLFPLASSPWPETCFPPSPTKRIVLSVLRRVHVTLVISVPVHQELRRNRAMELKFLDTCILHERPLYGSWPPLYKPSSCPDLTSTLFCLDISSS
jgi:hypothetical protein